MHACIYVCIYVCMYACMHVCMYACMHVCMYVCMSMFECSLPAHTHTYTHVHSVCMYICMYVRMYTNFYLPCQHTRTHAVMCTGTHKSSDIHIHVYACSCMCVWVHIHFKNMAFQQTNTYTHTHTHAVMCTDSPQPEAEDTCARLAQSAILQTKSYDNPERYSEAASLRQTYAVGQDSRYDDVNVGGQIQERSDLDGQKYADSRPKKAETHGSESDVTQSRDLTSHEDSPRDRVSRAEVLRPRVYKALDLEKGMTVWGDGSSKRPDVDGAK